MIEPLGRQGVFVFVVKYILDLFGNFIMNGHIMVTRGLPLQIVFNQITFYRNLELFPFACRALNENICLM